MNKITQLMHKVMIVKITLIVLSLSIISCNKKDNIDNQLFNLVLEESNFYFKDSIFLDNKKSNKRAIDFFNLRSKRTRIVYGDPDPENKSKDSLFYLKKIIDTIKVVKNDYLKTGKGVDKTVERFLKDSFNIVQANSNWNFEKVDYNIFLKNQIKACKQLTVSKPVYNLKRDKAIVFTARDVYSGAFEESIYLYRKGEKKWKLIFKQKNNTRYMRGLKKNNLIK